MTAASTPTFTEIPILDLSLSQTPATRPFFLSRLREALIVTGFFYLVNAEHWIPASARNAFVQKSKALFDLPLEEKEKIAMINSKHFLGYSRMGHERTARKVDFRESIDFLSPLPAPGPEDPVYMNVQGPNQWPDEQEVPGFRQSLEEYLAAIGRLGDEMKILVAEALGLEPTALTRFFSDPPRNKLSLLKYPDPKSLASADFAADTHDDTSMGGQYQGIGPHKDGGILTFLLQATPHAGLEAQNKNGDWIAVPPIANSLVVNVGRSLEALTRGVCTATTHRVNLSAKNFIDGSGNSMGPRFSFPVFQTLKLDLGYKELQSLRLPASVTALASDRSTESEAEHYFAHYHRQCPGIGLFIARLTSHPDVAERWYPELAAQALIGQEFFAAMSEAEASMSLSGQALFDKVNGQRSVSSNRPLSRL